MARTKTNRNGNNIEINDNCKQINDKNYQCQHVGCSKTFRSRSARIYHQKRCNINPVLQSPRRKGKAIATDNGVQLKCRYCPKTFKHKSSLSRHQDRYCDAARLFAGKSPLKKQPRIKKYYHCPNCGKVFDRLSKYNIHLITHQRELYKCQDCSRKFKRIDRFQNHSCSSVELESMSFVYPQQVNSLPSESEEPSLLPFEESDQSLITNEGETLPLSFSSGVKNSSMVNIHNSTINEGEPTFEVSERSLEGYIDSFGQDYDTDQDVFLVLPNDYIPNVPIADCSKNDQCEGDYPETCCQDPISIQDRRDEAVVPGFTTDSQSRPAEDIDVMEVDDVELEIGEFHTFFSNCVLENMRKIKNKPYVFMPILYDYLGDNLSNDNIIKHIYKKMGIRRKRFLKHIKNFQESCGLNTRSLRGNQVLGLEKRQQIHDTWLSHSNVTVDRRNGRDQVGIRKSEFIERYGDINDPLVTFVKNKRNVEIAKATRHIATKTVREICTMMEKNGQKVSLGSVFKYRPFYVGVASEREKLECLCKVCINARCLFKTVMKVAENDLNVKPFDSITQYLIDGRSCMLSKNGYVAFDCIMGTCSLCSGVVKPSSLNGLDLCDKVVTYYQFESVSYKTNKEKEAEIKSQKVGQTDEMRSDNEKFEEDVVSRHGKKRVSKKKKKEKKRTERVMYNTPVNECKAKLDRMAKKYLIHRYDVEHDKFVWPLIRQKASDRNAPIAHCDYSENIQEIPKFQPQDMHFNKKSHSLHCTVIHLSMDPQENQYLYHFSDITKHNWAHTQLVDKDWEKDYFAGETIVRKKNDNCRVQYKCGDSFGAKRKEAQNSRKTYINYYGSSGHGRGLVDSMSSFGVKGPLRKEIVNFDFYFSSAAELVRLFSVEKNMCERFHYSEITEEEFYSQEKPEAFPLDGNTKMHCIVFHPDGRVEMARHICECDECFNGNLSKCLSGNECVLYPKPHAKNPEDISDNTSDSEEEHDEEEDNEDDEEDFQQTVNCLADDLVGNVIALQAPANVRASFYLCVVLSSSIASEHMSDAYEHHVLKGEKYLVCNYLRIVKEHRGYTEYEKMDRKVFITPKEILMPYVQMSDNYELSNEEKQWLEDMQSRY